VVALAFATADPVTVATALPWVVATAADVAFGEGVPSTTATLVGVDELSPDP